MAQVAGPSGQMCWIRDGPNCLDARNITEAVDNSYVPMFGEIEYDPVRQFSSVPIEEQLDALGRAVDAGKIRYIGLSNETPYGVMKFLHIAENNARYPKIVCVQVVRRYSEGESRYNLSRHTLKAAAIEYLRIANKYGLHPVSLAIAFVLSHPLVASAVFGVTKSWQLQEVVNACSVELTSEIIADINEVHAKFPNPCP
ncbi:Aldo/keto reductase [Corchorus olitorius]|uniref:Aldo/keto reductase n=1 Tax=Corchorus olitorius TaxID=93759 RepID=A0A1R3KHQ8_9ROSI|nr:Aldo/keto reductase [Corchorus olitorius]